ncbi:MAG: lytic transglycosylase domain-containing protein [Acutalibacteraceae bacterium]
MSRSNRRPVPKKKHRAVKIVLILFLLLCCAGIFLYTQHREILKQFYPLRYEEQISEYAGEEDLDPYLVMAVIRTESSFDPQAVSSAGACGLMQMTPQTLDWVCMLEGVSGYEEEDLFDPSTSIRFGCALLRYLIDKYQNVETALAAYNAGVGNVDSWLQDSTLSDGKGNLTNIPIAETREYVKKVMQNREIYQYLYSNFQAK